MHQKKVKTNNLITITCFLVVGIVTILWLIVKLLIYI